jgi:zinc and cadmium transporter
MRHDVGTATWIYALAAVALDGCAALVAGLLPERSLERTRGPLLGFAAGVLLATTFLDVLPEAIDQLGVRNALGALFATMVLMALLEWTVGHRMREGQSGRRLAAVLLAADGFHNAADGAAIAAAFLVSPRLGAMASVAVIAHEVPEELADYVLLRHSGMSRPRALIAMVGVQLTAAIGAALALLGSTLWQSISGFALAVAAGTFVHIAEADLVPTILETRDPRRRVAALVGLLAGVAVVLAESL